jgi:hypothetical protein
MRERARKARVQVGHEGERESERERGREGGREGGRVMEA